MNKHDTYFKVIALFPFKNELELRSLETGKVFYLKVPEARLYKVGDKIKVYNNKACVSVL